MMTTYATLHFVLLLSVAGIQAQTSTQTEWPVTVGEAIQNSLKPGDSHIYTMEPGSGRFVYGFVMQESVGVAVAVYDPNGKKAAEFDGPARGKISFQFDTEAAGRYRIGVTPSGQDEGDYSILVSVVEPVATDPAGRTDQLMAEYTGEDVPGAAVLVMKDGHIVFQKSYGMASLTYGTPFPQWMKENLFEPLEMHHTVVQLSPAQVVPNRSMGYSIGGDGVYTEVTDLGGVAGAGGIHTTLGDLAKWIRNLNHPVIGTPEMIEEMATPFELTDGNSTTYGLGLDIGDYKGLPNYNHGGADMAHRSMMMVFPGIDGAVVTQSNLASYRFPVTDQVIDLFFGEYLEKEVKEEEAEFVYEAEKFDLLAGRYELPGNIITFVRDAERIYLQPTGLPTMNLTATSDSTFNLAGVGASITFHLNENATADSLTLHSGGNQIAHKMTEFNLSTDAMAEVAGRYYSEEIETLYTVLLEEDNLYLRHYQADNDFVLIPGSEDRFYASFPLSSVEFVRNKEGQITGFKASNGRTRDVLFERQD